MNWRPLKALTLWTCFNLAVELWILVFLLSTKALYLQVVFGLCPYPTPWSTPKFIYFSVTGFTPYLTCILKVSYNLLDFWFLEVWLVIRLVINFWEAELGWLRVPKHDDIWGGARLAKEWVCLWRWIVVEGRLVDNVCRGVWDMVMFIGKWGF